MKIHDLIMACIQGFTEFLPVSSSGHLLLFQEWFTSEKEDLAFSIFLHAGTLLSVLFWFRKELKEIVFELKEIAKNPKTLVSRNYVIPAVIAATIPTGIIGLAAKKYLREALESPLVAGLCFPVTMAAVYMVDHTAEKRAGKGKEQITLLDAFIIGISQGIAVLPGLSRSGITVASSVMLGYSRKKAFSLSFILSIPAIAGALLLESRELQASVFQKGIGFMSIYLAAAFFCGIISLLILEKLLLSGRWKLFSAYLFVISAIFWIKKLF